MTYVQGLENQLKTLFAKCPSQDKDSPDFIKERKQILKEICSVWDKITFENASLTDGIKVSKNENDENDFNSPEITFALVIGHRKASEYSLAIFLNNLFYSFIDEANTKRIFEREVTMVGVKNSYLKMVLITQDLKLKERYQEIILKHIVSQKEKKKNYYARLFLMRDNIKSNYKNEILKELSKETINTIYLELYNLDKKILYKDFQISETDSKVSITYYFNKIEHAEFNKKREMQKRLRDLKSIEDYLNS